ncbi:hypothetical protein PCLA_04f0347 [Pseudomonas citronellolis]|nr:hypothetical protein PCLA_04f0347 [Pseudomonas citronellolis]
MAARHGGALRLLTRAARGAAPGHADGRPDLPAPNPWRRASLAFPGFRPRRRAAS